MEEDKKKEIDYKILLDSGIRFFEDALLNLKTFVEKSSFAKNNKIEIDSIFREMIQKTLDVLESIKVKVEMISELDKLITKEHFEKLEYRLNLLENKVSNLGFATKIDIKELENRINEKLKNIK